jgi:hypothetical protein
MAFFKQPLSDRRRTWPGVAFCCFFICFGMIFVYAFLLRPILGVWAARSWTQTNCRIISSKVGEHDGSKGPTYSVDIVFAYTLGGHRYQGRRYDFMEGSSSGYDSKQAIVDQYPHGRRTVCYVNPANPADAVLDRDYPADLWWGVLMLIFPLFGIGGLVAIAKGYGQTAGGKLWAPASGVTAWGQTVKSPAGDIGIDPGDLPGRISHDAPVELTPAMTSGYKAAVATILLTAFGGGFAAIVITNLPGWRAHGVFGNAFIFACILGFVTLFTLFGAIAAYMRMSDPCIHLRLAPGTLRLGQDFALEWQTQGGRRQLSQLCIGIECCEEADYQGNKSSGTNYATFFYTDLVNTQAPDQLTTGTMTLTLPDNIMHSFNGGRNRISWKIKVRGKVPGWVGVKDEYPIIILPAGWEANS